MPERSSLHDMRPSETSGQRKRRERWESSFISSGLWARARAIPYPRRTNMAGRR